MAINHSHDFLAREKLKRGATSKSPALIINGTITQSNRPVEDAPSRVGVKEGHWGRQHSSQQPLVHAARC
jgi:hypothetical protein